MKETLEQLLKTAIHDGASDIHIDPSASALIIKTRRHGLLKQAHSFSMDIHEELISCIKVLCRLRTDVHHAAQDGRYEFVLDKHVYDMRVSIVPTFYGENAVFRILKRESVAVSFAELGFNEESVKNIEASLVRSSGLIIVSGPTGGGKTTTLHSMLSFISSSGRNIVTLEDPIEYLLENARQIQISQNVGVDFESMLRGLLRQDPDVVMIGEVRDKETALSLLHIASTGHLALSTIHAPNAYGVLGRLSHMGIHRPQIASSLSLIVYQKLVRELCKFCRKEVEVSEEEKNSIAKIRGPTGDLSTRFKSYGCEFCDGSGCDSRICVNELISFSKEIKALLVAGATEDDIMCAAKKEGFKSIEDQAWDLVRAGDISLETAINELLI